MTTESGEQLDKRSQDPPTSLGVYLDREFRIIGAESETAATARPLINPGTFNEALAVSYNDRDVALALYNGLLLQYHAAINGLPEPLPPTPPIPRV
jgi:hypothetical protein